MATTSSASVTNSSASMTSPGSNAETVSTSSLSSSVSSPDGASAGGARQNPPKFNEGTSYGNWKRKILMWTLVTGYTKAEQAIVVLLTAFEGNAKAERAISELKADDLHCAQGMEILLRKLDDVFKSDKMDDAYEAYTKFIRLEKSLETSMSDFIIEFEHRYHRMSEHGMKLPDSILSFKLVDASKISSSERQLAFTIANDMDYNKMKSALKRIFSSSKNESENGDTKAISIRAEACYVSRKPIGPKQFFRPEIRTKQYNPKNKHGEISRCAICDSKMHWADKCPHNPRRRSVNIAEGDDNACGSKSQLDDSDEGSMDDSTEFVNAVFLTESQENEIYLSETSGCAILDTACTKTVCGKSWLDDYMNKLDDNTKKTVKIQKGGTGFKFGDGRKVVSIKNVLLPAVIAGMPCHIKTDVVEDKLPLLLSKTTLKKTRTTIDLKNDKATMLGKPVKLQLTTNGHYCIDVHPGSTPNATSDGKQVFMSSKETAIESKSDKKKEIMKLHKQFGHASKENLIRLLKNGGRNPSTDVTQIIHDVIVECEICALYKKPPPRPVVSLTRAQDVNDTVALDLHQLAPNLWYLHIIDEFSRFSSAAVISSKTPAVIVQKFLQNWISIFGAPRRVLSDNGGEFNNEEFRDMCENFNISVMTTPAYSPWCNGICERHNQILTNILMKVKKDVQCSWETALAWAVSAKNALLNNNGFSPSQIMLGRGLSLPSTMSDKLPALEGKTMSQKVAEHIIALHATRKAFIESESSEKIRKALRTNTRPFSGKFEMGEDVYYKRSDGNEWKGPARVLGQDGVLLFLRHGGQLIRAHASRVQRIQSKVNPPDAACTQKAGDEEEKTEENDSADLQNNVEKTQENDCGSADEVTLTPMDNVPASPDLTHLEGASPRSDTCSETSQETSTFQTNRDQQLTDQIDKISLKKSQVVKFKSNGTTYEAKILSRAGKASGKYRNCFNVEFKSPTDSSGTQKSVDFDQVQELVIMPPTQESTSFHDTPNDADDQVLVMEDIDFTQAKAKELHSWIENEVFDECDNVGQKCISVKWVCSLKNTDKGILPKARLVARGFEDPDIGKVEKDSPTCSKDALRTIVAVTAQKGWKLQSMDVKTAFLQGERLKRDVYLTPPTEAKCMPGKIWKLKKCVYGLTDASLQWYDRVKRFMVDNGGKMTKCDPAVFCWHIGSQLQGVIAVHVDDFLWAGNHNFEKYVLTELRSTFRIGNEESKNFKYLGIEMTDTGTDVFLNQNGYISHLAPLKIDLKQKSNDSITTQEKEGLRSKIGQFLWVSSQTRPDIAYDVCVLATNFKNATVKDLSQANKVLRKLKSDCLQLKFHNLGPNENLKLVCYTDASFASLNDGGSQAGNLVFLVGENGYCNLLSWESKKIKRVVKSTLAAETLALSSGIDSAVYVASLFTELWNGDVCAEKIPIELVVDNLSLYDAIKSTKQVQDKRLRVDIAIVKEMISNKEISNVYWIEGKHQLADNLTKAGASSAKLLSVLHDGKF